VKLSLRIPLLFGLIILISSASIGIITLQISSSTLEETIISTVHAENQANSLLLAALLNGQLDILGEIAKRPLTMTMDWESIRPSLTSDVQRIGALDMALVSPAGIASYVLDNTTADLHDRAYIIRAMSGEKNIGVVFSRVTSAIVVMFAAPVYASEAENAPVVGVLLARKDGGRTLSDIVVNLNSSMKSGYSYLADVDGTFIAHPNTELVTTQFNPIKGVEEDTSLQPLADVVSRALREKNGTARYTYNGNNLIGYYTEVPGFNWLLFTSIEKDEVDGKTSTMRIIVLIVSVVFIFSGIITAILIGRSITRPLSSVANTLVDISSGDLTKVILVKSSDEIGNMADSLNKTLEKVRAMIFTIKQKSTMLSDIGNDLASNMNQTAAAVNQIAANIQSIKGRVINQSASVTQTNATMEMLVGNLNRLDGHVKNQGINVSQASSAIEEMVSNIRNVTDTLINNSSNVETLTGASEAGHNGLQGVAQDIQEIARESEGLLEINSVMENISSQTNLLSMNAAIEAAHAGETGKGFAVVAAEIRKLAESSSNQSKTISNVLKKIKESIDKITKSTENVMDKFEAIDSSVKTVSQQEENIRNAMEGQGTGSKQILEGISNVNDITRQVTSSTNEMLGGAKEVMQESSNLEKITQEITSGMNEMASGADQINVAVNHVNDLSGKNREGIDALMQEVSRFKVE
jgi:methyl-accepting chemotaxis protein